MENFQVKDLKRLSFLGQFVGYVMIAYSIFITLQGLSPYIVGAVPGLVGIYMESSSTIQVQREKYCSNLKEKIL